MTAGEFLPFGGSREGEQACRMAIIQRQKAIQVSVFSNQNIPAPFLFDIDRMPGP